jgi:hypothetical protein
MLGFARQWRTILEADVARLEHAAVGPAMTRDLRLRRSMMQDLDGHIHMMQIQLALVQAHDSAVPFFLRLPRPTHEDEERTEEDDGD